jgi:hypothetical protein
VRNLWWCGGLDGSRRGNAGWLVFVVVVVVVVVGFVVVWVRKGMMKMMERVL